MKVIKADTLGFCMGVRRAVETAVSAARDSKYPVFTLGRIIHNPKVLSDLENLGIKSIDESSLASCAALRHKDGAVIIRAHGISPQMEQLLRETCVCRVIDATCPNVKKNQLKAQELSREGFNIFLAGEKEHAEITGLLGYCRGAPFCEVTGSAQEAQEKASCLLKKNKDAKTALLGQTTISPDEYAAAAKEIKKYFPSLLIISTICRATEERRVALRALLEKTNAVIIAGGRESANTRRLYETALESGKPCVLAQNADDIPPEFFNFDTVGVCAGASTPDSTIDEIENALNRGCK
ncbi:MAG: 4-hydroxy-3-methylbut-2-enyl diphosphate reductase [Treponema sp.]|nr:4-hydroxy-3-methylbut-2-enyl diphosphate reductase [Treponema sp.]